MKPLEPIDMLLGKVIGPVVSTVKHKSMHGCKLLLVQPLLADGKSPDGHPVLAVDQVGAGRDEVVVLTSDGRFAREFLNTDATPVRWTTVGIRDE